MENPALIIFVFIASLRLAADVWVVFGWDRQDSARKNENRVKEPRKITVISLSSSLSPSQFSSLISFFTTLEFFVFLGAMVVVLILLLAPK